MKKLILSILLLAFCCTSNALAKKPIKILVSTAPLAAITKLVTGDLAHIEILQSADGCPHHYSLKPSDIKKMRGAEYFIYIDPKFDQFAERLTQKFSGQTIKVSDLKTVNFATSGGYDDWHFWLNLENVRKLCDELYDILNVKHPEMRNTLLVRYEYSVFQVKQLEQQKKQALKQHDKYLLTKRSLSHFFTGMGVKTTLLPNLKKGSLRSYDKFDKIIRNNPSVPIVITKYQERKFYEKYGNPIMVIDAERWALDDKQNIAAQLAN